MLSKTGGPIPADPNPITLEDKGNFAFIRPQLISDPNLSEEEVIARSRAQRGSGHQPKRVPPVPQRAKDPNRKDNFQIARKLRKQAQSQSSAASVPPSDIDLAASAMATPADFAEVVSEGKFIKYKHVEYLSCAITALVNRQISARVLVAEMPPRHGKSELCSKYTPAWFVTNFPDKRVILASFESSFAASWGEKARDIMLASPFPVQMSQTKLTREWWETKQGGGMATAGAGGPITGKGADLLIIDDPIKNQEEAMSALMRDKIWDWWVSTAFTRLEPGGVVLILMTRWHEGDLVGRLIKKAQEGGMPICRVRFPAVCEEDEDIIGRHKGDPLCPERYDSAALAEIQSGSLPSVWDAMYQQRPSSEAGNIVKKAWIRFWSPGDMKLDSHGRPSDMEEYTMSWDMAFTDHKHSSWVVGQVWGRRGADMFLLDQYRGHVSCADTLVEFLRLLLKWPMCGTKLVENKANGPAVISFLSQKIPGITDVNPDVGGSKFARFHAIAYLFKAGNVYLPNPNLYPWVQEYVHELTTFPNADADDQCDATSQVLSTWVQYGVSYAGSAQAFTDLSAYLPTTQLDAATLQLPAGFGVFNQQEAPGLLLPPGFGFLSTPDMPGDWQAIMHTSSGNFGLGGFGGGGRRDSSMF